MNKKKYSRDAYDISEEEYQKLCTQSGADEVIEAVRQYNEIISYSGYFEEKEVDGLLKKEAEEKDTKLFLDGIFDLAEKRNR